MYHYYKLLYFYLCFVKLHITLTKFAGSSKKRTTISVKEKIGHIKKKNIICLHFCRYLYVQFFYWSLNVTRQIKTYHFPHCSHCSSLMRGWWVVRWYFRLLLLLNERAQMWQIKAFLWIICTKLKCVERRPGEEKLFAEFVLFQILLYKHSAHHFPHSSQTYTSRSLLGLCIMLCSIRALQ